MKRKSDGWRTDRRSTVRTIAAVLFFSSMLGIPVAVAQVASSEVPRRPAIRPVPAPKVLKPTREHRYVTKLVSQLMQQEHISRKPIDNTISERALTMFFELLDPMKVYFQKSDIEEFSKYKTSIDDYVNQGDTRLAFKIFQRLLKRVDDRAAEVETLLNADHDFTLDEKLYTDFDSLDYANGDAEAQDLWRRRIKYELLVRKADDKSPEEAKEEIARRYRSWAKRKHQIDSGELLELFITAVTTSFDPHTTYMSPESHTNFEINMRLNLDGIGAALKPDDGYTVVTKIIPGGAADKQGDLKPEDKIVSVGEGADGEMVDVVDMKLSNVVKKIRGQAGTVVRLGVQHEGGTKTEIINITRARIELKDSEARSDIVEHGKRPDGRPYRIGVIDLPSFYMDMEGARRGLRDYKSTSRDVAVILSEFRREKVDVCVLDLRRNGGGSLTEAINTTGLFIDQGPVVQVKDADGRVQHYDDIERGMAWGGPLVVVTSKFSASASEILAGAIQDYKRGIVVGDKSTHGKGTVQSLLDLGSQLFSTPNPPNYGALKITMQQFYLPKGASTQKRGVLADVVLPSLTNEMDGISESDLDYAIEFDQVNSAAIAAVNRVTNDLLVDLRGKSKSRMEESEEFAKLRRNLARYREQRDRKYVTLNEAQFMKEREEIDAEKEEEDMLEEQLDGGERPVVEDSFYFTEVLDVAADLVNFEEKRRVAQLN